MSRFLVFAFSAALTVPAAASFELALVADQDNGGRNYVHRYDVDAGVYLGRFDVGNGGNSILSMHLLRSSARVAVLTSDGSLREFNIWTGAVVREALLSGNGFVINDAENRLASFVNDYYFGVYEYPSLAPLNTAGYTPQFPDYVGGAFVRNSNDFIGLMGSNNATVTRSPGLDFNGTAIGTISGTFAGSQNIARVGGSSQFAVHNGTFVGRYNLVSNTIASDVLANPVSGWSPSAVAEAHIGNLVLGKASGIHGIARYGQASTFDNRYFATPQVGNGTHMAAFLAPEPGTMVALGLGAAALLRRKKGKRA